MTWHDGLSAANAIGGNGRYREHSGVEQVALPSCVWNGTAFCELGERGAVLYEPELPERYQRSQERRDWTGRAIHYSWGRGRAAGDLTVDLRSCLPGPYFHTSGDTIRLRSEPKSDWREFHELRTGAVVDMFGASGLKGARLFRVTSDRCDYLLVASRNLTAIEVISHRHYAFRSSAPGFGILVVPIHDAGDIPDDDERQQLWLRCAQKPPLTISERFRERDGSLQIRGQATGFDGATAGVVALPQAATLLGESGGLVDVPKATTLLRTWYGPLRMCRGARYDLTIATDWQRARVSGGEPIIDEDLRDIPEELTYAGDATWEPGTCMDQLFSLRAWAPYLHVAPERLRQPLIEQLRVPSAKEVRDAVEIIREPSCEQDWGRWRSMWAHCGDACYDIDWYNGFGLSGLARALFSPLPELNRPAAKTVRGTRRQRAALLDYFAVFHDWSHMAAWIDPREQHYNADCIHNGLEGILGEAQLRDWEGDADGAAYARYLAARTGVSLRASMEIPTSYQRWLQRAQHGGSQPFRTRRMVTWSPTEGVQDRPEAPVIGVQGYDPAGAIQWCTGATRNPYVLAGHNPAWNALLRQHSPRGRWRALVRDWETGEPGRAADWIAYYIGTDWKKRRAQGDQEARIAAAVFYSMAPEVCLRLWTVGEKPAAIEARFAHPLNLNEQLLLRGGFTLSKS